MVQSKRLIDDWCCSKSMGCAYLPEDFKEVTFDSMVNLYNEGQLSFCRILSGKECIAIIPKLPRKGCKRWPMTNDEAFAEGECEFFVNGVCTCEKIGKLPRYCDDLYKLTDSMQFTIIQELLDTKTCLEWIPYMVMLDEVFWYLVSEEAKKNDTSTDGHFEHDVCKFCGGRCCQRCGCYFAPSDFKQLTLESLREVLDKGYVSIIPLNAERTGIKQDTLVLKMRDEGAEVYDKLDRRTGGCIVHSDDTGCPFDDNNRPFGGRALVPNLVQGCFIGYSFKECAEDWLPYQTMLRILADEFDGVYIEFEGIL